MIIPNDPGIIIMKKLLTLLIFMLIGYNSQCQIVNIPDANFKARLLAANPSNTIAYNGMVAIKIDSNNNSEIEVSEALQVTVLNVSIADIYDMTGIGSFTNLRSLNCNQNHISLLNVANLVNLKLLYCNLNLLTSLNLSDLPHLLNLECAENILTHIDLTNVTDLQTLSCRFNFLTSLQLNGLPNLYSLNCGYNQLTGLNVSYLTQLTNLDCQSNQFTALDLNSLVNLNSLNCSYNQLTTLDLSGLNELATLNCSHNQITALDINNLLQLALLNCEFNLINNPFIFNSMPDLQSAYCHNNQIPSLSFSDVPNLQVLDCSMNQITALDVSSLPLLSVLNCHDNTQLVHLNIKNGINEPFLDFSDNPNLLYMCVDEEQLASVQNLIAQYGYTNCQANSSCDLAANHFDINSYFKVFPNPAQNSLHLETLDNITLKAITIFDILGQAVLTIPNAEHDAVIDISDLKTGTYFIKISTDKGMANPKFIKDISLH
jgi:Leucine-rich repeat (LRR) protein